MENVNALRYRNKTYTEQLADQWRDTEMDLRHNNMIYHQNLPLPQVSICF
jgi:hypothetical protein